MANTKFELTGNTKIWCGKTLYQIRALNSFGSVCAGELGGYVEEKANLSELGNAWVSGNAWVCGGEHTITPAMAVRSDGYTFVVYKTATELRITAGCRDFSWSEAAAHWGDPAHQKREESFRIITFLREQVEAREPAKTEVEA